MGRGGEWKRNNIDCHRGRLCQGFGCVGIVDFGEREVWGVPFKGEDVECEGCCS